MSATIYQFEFQKRLKSVITWSLAVAAILLIIFSIFTGFADQAELMNQVWAKFPPELLQAFGLDRIDLSTVLGYYAFTFIFVQICLAVQASNYGFGLVSVEESEWTADFLLSKPVSRVQVMTSKLLAALTSLLITNLVVWICSFAAIELFKGERSYDVHVLLLLLISIIIFQLFYLCVGLAISLLVRRVRSVTPYSLGLAFGTYVLAAFSGQFADVALEYLTPFKHLDPTYIVKQGTYDTPLVILNLAVTLVSLGLSYWLYIRRDIPAVA